MKTVIRILFGMICVSFLSCSDSRMAGEGQCAGAQEEFENVLMIDASLRTPQQQALLELLVKTLVDNVKIEGNHFVFLLSEEEFVSRGIPRPYYIMVMDDVKRNNDYIEATGESDLERLWQESREALAAKLNVVLPPAGEEGVSK